MITNIITQKKYIGQTRRNIITRWKEHISLAFSNRNKSKGPLQYSIKRHGSRNFTIKLLENCDNDDVDDKERHYIKTLKTRVNEQGYNISRGGSGYRGPNTCNTQAGEKNSFYGKTHTEITKQKIRTSLRRYNTLIGRGHKRVLTQEEKKLNRARGAARGAQKRKELWKKIGHPRLGKTHTQETKNKIRNAHKGKQLSHEHKKKIGDSHRNIPKGPFTTEHKTKLSNAAKKRKKEPRAIPVRRSDGVMFETLKDAMISVNKNYAKLIKDCCNGLRKDAYGYGWQWL